MSPIFYADAVLAALLFCAFIYDGFKWLNRKADEFEDRFFTGWLHYNVWGDPASWLQHGLTAAAIASAWGALGALVGSGFDVGFLHGAWIAAGMYVAREGLQAWDHAHGDSLRGPIFDRRKHPSWRRGYHAGWAIDGFCDLWGPALVLWLALR